MEEFSLKTERLDIINGSYDIGIARASELLKQGKTVAIPTETVYGLAASAYSAKAIKKVFEAKGRPQDNPLIVHICDMHMLYDVAEDIPEIAVKCAESFWPGPFTMVLKRAKCIASEISAGLDTVAVRMPSSKAARDIIGFNRIPLAAPSANLSGSPSPTTADHVLNDLDGLIDAVVIGDDCDVGVESTVISLYGNSPRLLRPGGVTVEQLREIMPDIIIDPAVLSKPENGEKVASPGMKYKHYAPKTDTFLVEGNSNSFADFVNSKSDAAAVCFEEEKEFIKIKNIVYGSRSDATTLAKNVFSVLRQVDKAGVKEIYIHAPQKSGVGLAVYNRLIRAAAYRVISL